MVNYNCQRCGYNTNRKSAFKKHLLRKNLCKSKLNEITRYVLLCTNGFEEEATNFKLSTKNQQNIYKISTKNVDKKSGENKEDNNICKFCSKKLSCYKSKWRHEKICKKRKESKEEILEKLLIQKDKLISKQGKQINKLLLQLTKMSDKIGNNNNNNINSHNKIIINAYGCENIEYITEKVLKKLVNKPGTAIPNLLKMIHFNDKYPENKNLKVTNIHDPYIKVHDGDAWKLKNKGDIIEDIIINKRDILDGAVVDSEQDKKYIDKLNRLDETIDDKKNNFVEKSVKDVLFNYNDGVPLT